MSAPGRSLLTDALIRVVPAAAVVLLAVWYFAYRAGQDAVSEAAADRLQATAGKTAERVGDKIDYIRNSLELLARNAILVNGLVDAQQRNDYLPAFLRTASLPGQVSPELTLVDYRGRPVLKTGVPLTWAEASYSGDQALLELTERELRLATPVRYWGRPEGALTATYARADLATLLSTQTDSGNTVALTIDGVHVANLQGNVDELPDSGSLMISVSAALPKQPGWQITMWIERGPLEAPLRSQANWMLAGLVTILILLVLALTVVGRRITRPVQDMVTAIGEIESTGDLASSLPTSGPLEIRHLSTTFNDLMARLRDTVASRADLEAANNDLDIYRRVVESVTDAIMIKDREGRYLLANQVVIASIGKTEQEIIGKTDAELFGEAGAAMMAAEQALFDRNEPATYEESIEFGDTTRTFLTTRIPLTNGPNGQPAMIGLCRDITADRAMRTQLEDARQEAEAANLAKSTFLASMSHEIRTPMNGVIGMADMLVDADLPDHLEQYAHTIRNSGRTMLAIINDVLDISRIEAGRMTLETEVCPLRPVIEDSVALFTGAAGSREVRLSCLIDNSVPNEMRIDPVRLRQVISNLVGNAVKFTVSGFITVTTTCDETHLQIDVTDTGNGIAEDQIERIFNPFSQAKGERQVAAGSGLGLAISRELVSMMHGELTCTSTLGEGSTFTARMLLKEPSEPPRLPAASSTAHISVACPHTTRALVNYLALVGITTDASGDETPALLLTDQQPDTAPDADVVAVIDSWLDQPSWADRVLNPPLTAAAVAKACGRRPRSQDDSGEYAVPTWASTQPSVLVVDDNPVNRTVACAMLRRLGCLPSTADDGRAGIALATAAGNNWDLILMDLQMPEIDGFAATREIRKYDRQHDGHSVIIALTAQALAGDREACIEAGMDDYLSKPITLKALAACLQRWLPKPETAS